MHNRGIQKTIDHVKHLENELWDLAHQLLNKTSEARVDLKIDASDVRIEIVTRYNYQRDKSGPRPKYNDFKSVNELDELLYKSTEQVINNFLSRLDDEVIFLEKEMASVMSEKQINVYDAKKQVENNINNKVYPSNSASILSRDLAFNTLRLNNINALNKKLFIHPGQAFEIVHQLKGDILECLLEDIKTLYSHAEMLYKRGDLSDEQIDQDFLKVIRGERSLYHQATVLHRMHRNEDGSVISHEGYSMLKNPRALLSEDLFNELAAKNRKISVDPITAPNTFGHQHGHDAYIHTAPLALPINKPLLPVPNMQQPDTVFNWLARNPMPIVVIVIAVIGCCVYAFNRCRTPKRNNKKPNRHGLFADSHHNTAAANNNRHANEKDTLVVVELTSPLTFRRGTSDKTH